MSLFPNDILTALKTELETKLGYYVDKVTIRPYRRDRLPDFEYYCIVINPVQAQFITYPANQKQVQAYVEIVLLGKVFNGDEDSMIADSPHSVPPNIGLLPMYEDIAEILFKNDLGGVIELIPGIEELDDPTNFSTFMDDDRVGFFCEAKIAYKFRGHRFVSLEWKS